MPKLLTFEEALALIVETVRPLAAQVAELAGAGGAVLASDLVAEEDSPPFDKSQMDGYAVRSIDLERTTALRVMGEVTAGRQFVGQIEAGEAVRIMTGAPIPSGADQVVPFEKTEFDAATSEVKVLAGAKSGGFVIRRGNSYRAGQRVLAAGTALRAAEIGLAAELGHPRLAVRLPPTVAVLTTGDELVPAGQRPGVAQIRNSNGPMLTQQMADLGGRVVSVQHAGDDKVALRQAVEVGLQAKIMCLTGGVSAGKLDLVPDVLRELQVREVFHKVQIKPGKPVWFGVASSDRNRDGEECYIFGLPGNPVSSMVCAELFVGTAIRRCLGIEPVIRPRWRIPLAADFHFQDERTLFLPSRVEPSAAGLVVRPLDWHGSSDLAGTVGSNALAIFPAGERQYRAGELVELWRVW